MELKDKTSEYALVWALPIAAWAGVFVNGVDDLDADKPGRLLLRLALALVLSGAAWLMCHNLAVLDEATERIDGMRTGNGRLEQLRNSLAQGGTGAAVYAERLRRLLDEVDRFFGDVGQAPPAWQRRLMGGLRSDTPLWTASAYDRCLSLALLYPVAVLLLVWMVTGHGGPAAQAIGLLPGVPTAHRLSVAVAISAAGIALQCGAVGRLDKGRRLAVLAASMGGLTLLLFVLPGAVEGAFVPGLLLAFGGAVRMGGAGTAAAALAFACFGAGAAGGPWTTLIAGASGCLAAYAYLHRDHRLHAGWLNLLVTVFGAVGCMALPAELAGDKALWRHSGVVLMFAGLLTLLNAPFDWLSLGITRGLLRRGLELQGPVPWALAIVDAALAGALIAVLSAVIVLGVQLVNALALRAGGQSLTPIAPLLHDLALHPTAAEYWWLHALLLATLVPSLLNLTVGGFSLLRGWPAVTVWLLRHLPGGPQAQPYRPAARWQVAAVLTGQWVGGALLGLAAQGLLLWGILGGLLPQAGWTLLGLMRALAALNLPERLIPGLP